MQAGKISSERLQNTVLNNITHHREDVLVNSGLGEDSAVIDFGEEVLAISSDPITGAGEKAGYLAVHVACNDLAATGAEPIGIQVILLLPPGSTDEKISALMSEIDETASGLSVQVLGGHTEIIDDVSRSLIAVTAIGKAGRDRYVPTGGARAGDDIVLTKGVGLEGAFILASDFEEHLISRGVSRETIRAARNYQNHISVLQEGLIAADFGVNSMHDVTEGGLYGALTEMSQAARKGFVLNKSPQLVPDPVKEITARLNMDPFGLISSGSMVISTDSAEDLIELLEENDISAYVAGNIIPEGRFIKETGRRYELSWQGEDELWNFLEKI